MRWLLVFLVACGAAVPALPSKGGPAWIEVQTEHFTLWTDAGAARGTELVEQMEYLHQIVFGVAFPEHPTGGRTFAIALRDDWEVHAYLPKEFSAVSMLGYNAMRQPVILFAADTDESDGHVLTHELAHVISYVAIEDQPPWFSEGLAEFFEAVKLNTDKTVVDVGEPLHTQMYAQVHYQLVTGDQLFACRAMECRDHEFYMTAGLLFMYLANTHPAQLLELEDRLAKKEDDRKAWAATFPDLPIATIDRELRAWQMQGRHRVWHFEVKLAHPQIAQRTLGDADVLAIRAYLTLKHEGPDPVAEKAIAAALAADPTNVIARMVEYTRTKQISLDDARALAKAHPDDWRVWFLMLAAHATGEENHTAFARMCELGAKNPANVYDRDNCSAHPHDVVPGGTEHGDQPPTSK